MSSLLLTGVSLFAFDLPTLIDKAQQNEQVQAYEKRSGAEAMGYESVKDAYMPSINLGGSASYVDETGTIEVPETYKAYAEANFVILDGFKRENRLDEKKMLTKASRFDLEGFKKAISLQVIRDYFELQSVEADIAALENDRKQLQEQLSRFRLFRNAGIATDVDVERLNAAVANAEYMIAARQYETDTLRSKLALLSGTALEGEQAPQHIAIPGQTQAKRLDSLDAKAYRARATGYLAEQADSVYYPTLVVNDTYTLYDYENFTPAFPVEFPDKQNRLTFQLSINLIDFGAAGEQREAIKLRQRAEELELRYAEKSADADRALSLKAIERAKALMAAAEKSKVASDKTFAVVKKKYEARVVDYIVYLDALSKASEAHSQYHRAQSGLNTAYAAYIYYLGLDPKEYVQ